MVKFIDEEQQAEYLKALNALDNYNAKRLLINAELKRLAAEQKLKLTQIKKLHKEMDELAMTTNLDPYIKYLEEQIRATKEDRLLTMEERDVKVEMIKDWLDIYNKMRDTASGV